jgi:outer membrane protein assembly factor BamB
MKSSLSILALILAGSCTLNSPARHEGTGQESPIMDQEAVTLQEWRGMDRKGIYPDSGLLKKWPAEGPLELWSVEGIGEGFGSPVFAGDRLYVTGELDSMANLHCYTLEGTLVWRTTFGREWMNSYPGSRSAPTIAGELIYVGSGMGNLYCLDRVTGKVVWRRDFKSDFQGEYPLHGHSEAAIVSGNKVFWTPGGKKHNVVALDRFSGEMIWSHPGFRERPAYNPSQLVRLPTRELFVTFSAYHLMGFDTETGILLWSHAQDNLPFYQRKPGYGDTHANAVIFDSGAVYYAAGDGNGGVRLDLSEDGSEITENWRNPGFDSFMGGIVKIGNTIYGSGTSGRWLKAIDADNGVLTDSLGIGSGAVIAADHMLYYYNQRGEMKLVSFEDGNMKEISSFRIRKGTREHFSHPVIHRGILYQRHGNTLMAFDLRKDPN